MKKTNRMDINKAESLIEREFEWRKWMSEIPFIPMNSNWILAPIPPFGGAVARVIVRHKENTEAKVSVYLDCYEKLGCWDGPYWEIYPNQEDDVSRFDMQDVDQLGQAIEESLQAQINELKIKDEGKMNKEKIQERVDALEAELEGLRAELEKPEKLIWKSGIGDEYYTVMATAKLYRNVYNAHSYDLNNVMAYNAFKSKELAERVARKQRVERKLIMLAETLNKGWRPNGDDDLFEIEYDVNEQQFMCLPVEMGCFFGTVGFKDEKTADKAISQLTEQDIKDYFLWQAGVDND